MVSQLDPSLLDPVTPRFAVTKSPSKSAPESSIFLSNDDSMSQVNETAMDVDRNPGLLQAPLASDEYYLSAFFDSGRGELGVSDLYSTEEEACDEAAQMAMDTTSTSSFSPSPTIHTLPNSIPPTSVAAMNTPALSF